MVINVKILFDLTDLYDHISGIERYAMELSGHMIRQHPEHEYVLFFKKEIPAAYYEIVMQENVRSHVLPLCNKLLFRQFVLLWKLYSVKADAYVFLAFPEPVLFHHKNVITAMHDMGCFDCPSCMKFGSRWYFRLSNVHTFLRANRIITISKFSAKRILHYARRLGRGGEDKVRRNLRLAYCGVEDTYFCALASQNETEKIEQVRNKYGLPKHYILSLSTLEPRKNLSLLLEAYVQMSEKKEYPCLVLAGRRGWKISDMMEHYESVLTNKLIFTGYIEQQDLPWLYAGADCFVFPTLYEGFGMPPLEAMAAGTPVLSSDIAVMKEVLGNAAIYFKSNDCEDLQRKLEEILSESTAVIKEYAAAGRERAGGFSWKTQADKLNRIIKHSVQDM